MNTHDLTAFAVALLAYLLLVTHNPCMAPWQESVTLDFGPGASLVAGPVAAAKGAASFAPLHVDAPTRRLPPQRDPKERLQPSTSTNTT